MDPPALSAYGAASTVPSPVSRMMAAFAGDFREQVDVNLGVGYVNEQTIPHGRIRGALDRVLADPGRFRAPFNYGGPEGAAPLVEAVRGFYARRAIGGLTADDLGRVRIVVGASGATSLLEAAAAVLPTGIVITSDPIYYIYADVLARRGFEVIAVPEDDAGLDVDRLEAVLRRLGPDLGRVSFVYVVTVNNPTCSILSDQRRRRLVDVVADLSRRLGRQVPLLLDTAYELLLHDPAVTPPASALGMDELGIAYEIGTLSKILAPALRIGFMIGPHGPFMDAVVQHVSDVGFSAPLANQAMAACLLEQCVDEQLALVNAAYRVKAQATRRWIDRDLGAHVAACRGGSAGFYYYLTLDGIETHEGSPFFRYLSRATGDPRIDGPPEARHPRVIYIPGAFCVHAGGELVREGRRQLRLSYGFEEVGAIERGVGLMGEAAEWAARQAPSAT